MPGKADPDLSAAQDETLQILDSGRHKRKLQRGAHAANGFTLRLTQLDADKDALNQRLEIIARQGIPNYFGTQRFGYQGGNLGEAREYAARQALPEQRAVRSRLLSTARSYLFNRVLAARVADGSWQQAQVGDLLAFTDSRSFFRPVSPSAAILAWRFLIFIPPARNGEGPSPATGTTAALENAITAGESSLRDWLVKAGMEHERRILRLPIGRLTWHYPEPDILQLEFVLPPGCFATVLVRELVDLAPVGQTDSSCVF